MQKMKDMCCKALYGIGGSVLLFALVNYLYKRMRRVSVKNKTVVITGASSGLGEACAQVFYAEGSRVVLCGRRTEELERVKQGLLSSKNDHNAAEPIVATLDVTDPAAINTVIEEIIATCGQIDILINNAGIAAIGTVVNTTLDVYRRVMEVNYFGVVHVTKAVLHHMVDRRGGTVLNVSSITGRIGSVKYSASVIQRMVNQKSGCVVNVSSIQGRIGLPHRSAYAASKHALQAFTDCLRAEVASKNIHISIISPSYIKTQISHNLLLSDGKRYGEMSDAVQSGMTAEYAAQKVLDCVVYRYNEMLIGPVFHQTVPYFRSLLPNMMFRYLQIADTMPDVPS